MWEFYCNAEVQNNMDDFDKYLAFAWTYSYSRIFPALCFSQFALSVSFFFFFLQIVPTLGVHFIVAWFLTLFLDFSLGKRVHHVPLGSLKCSRLGRRTLSWEQNRSLKKRDKIHFFQGLFLTWLTYSFIENTIAGSALSLSKENYTLLSEAMCHCSQSRCFLPGMWGLNGSRQFSLRVFTSFGLSDFSSCNCM